MKSFDIVGGNFVDNVLSSLGVPDWCGHAYFELHVQVRLCFELAAGVGSLYARRGIPPGCHFNMAFIVALHLPWCGYLEVVGGFRPQPYADNLMCVRSHLNAFLVAARFTTKYTLRVGQAAAPSVCLCVCFSVLLSVSARI